MTAPFRTYPADSTPPAQTEKPPRFESPCPYPPCDFVASALREYQLAGMLTRHKRTMHENAFIDELAAKNEQALATVEAEPLVSVRVAACYYRRASMRAVYPEPSTVLVPERWHVASVFVTCQASGAFVAYKGRLGGSEKWELNSV